MAARGRVNRKLNRKKKNKNWSRCTARCRESSRCSHRGLLAAYTPFEGEANCVCTIVRAPFSSSSRACTQIWQMQEKLLDYFGYK